MATLNPFDLLDDDAEDPSQLVAVAKPLKTDKSAPVQPLKSAKMPTKPPPPSQAVREAKNGPGGRGGGGRGGFGRSNGGGGRGGGYGGYNRESRNNDAPRNENGYGGGGGGYRRSEEGDGERRVGGYRGGPRRGGFNNGESGDFERPPRRNYERHSGTGHGNEFKRDGAGRGNWGSNEDQFSPVTEESTTVVVEKAVEKQSGEEEVTDANKEKPVEEQAVKEPEDKEMTLEEYEKVLEEKRKALQATKIEERKVDTKAFDSMQQLSSKKSNNDDVFIKLGTEKDKRITEKEEKAKKSLSINEFLKPADGESYNPRGGYRGGRGRGSRGGPRGAVGGGNNQRYSAPAIGDTAQFPTLGK